MSYEAVGRTRSGWGRHLGTFETQEAAQACADEIAIGEGTETMVRPAQAKAVTE